MNLRAGVQGCISLTYFVFNFLFPGREKNLNSYHFTDNLYSGLRKNPRGN
jgi:hypothetical protein